MNNYEIISLALSAVTLVALWWQLYLIYKTYKADHERRQKQSTIEYLNEIRKLYRPVEYKLNTAFGDKIINVDKISDEDRTNIREFLSIVEHLSTGINVGVFDLTLVNQMSGAYFVTMYEKFIPYIKEQRRMKNNNNLYCEFSQFHSGLESMRREHESPAKMMHS
jgi:hypothetical protein